MSEKPIAVYAGDTFKNLIKSYAFDRMGRDPEYRREVLRKMAEKKGKGR